MGGEVLCHLLSQYQCPMDVFASVIHPDDHMDFLKFCAAVLLDVSLQVEKSILVKCQGAFGIGYGFVELRCEFHIGAAQDLSVSYSMSLTPLPESKYLKLPPLSTTDQRSHIFMQSGKQPGMQGVPTLQGARAAEIGPVLPPGSTQLLSGLPGPAKDSEESSSSGPAAPSGASESAEGDEGDGLADDGATPTSQRSNPRQKFGSTCCLLRLSIQRL